jgi:hypothetical protein
LWEQRKESPENGQDGKGKGGPGDVEDADEMLAGMV